LRAVGLQTFNYLRRCSSPQLEQVRQLLLLHRDGGLHSTADKGISITSFKVQI